MNSRVTLLVLASFTPTIGCSRNPSDETPTASVVKAGGDKANDNRDFNETNPKEPVGGAKNGEDADSHAKQTQPVLGGGTGTAFVVHPDGYLITNAHVVHKERIGQLKIDKVTVELVLDKKSYTAEVLGLDEKNDLALLKIDGKDLPALPLTERVELAEDVRAFGYPLTGYIGESINVTRGSVSAIQKGLVQTDTAINPGNSGGPLVNNKGEVVGVVTKRLRPELPEKPVAIGFAVPTNFVKSLLAKHKVELAPAKEQRPLKGVALARQVVPAVAFVRVTVLQATLETGRVRGDPLGNNPNWMRGFGSHRPSLSRGGQIMVLPYEKNNPNLGSSEWHHQWIMVWDVRNGKQLADVRIPDELRPNSLSRDGTAMSLWPRRFYDAGLRPLPLKTRKVVLLPMFGDIPKREFALPNRTLVELNYIPITFSKDAKLAAALLVEDAPLNGKARLPVQVWDLSAGTSRTIARVEINDWTSRNPPWQLAFSPDGRMIAVALNGRDQTTHVKCLEVSTGQSISSADLRPDRVSWEELAFSHDGKHLLAVGHLIDPSNGKTVHKLPVPGNAWLANTDDLIVIPHPIPKEGHLTLWDVSQGKEVLTIKDTVFSRDELTQYRDRMSRYPLDEFLVLQTKPRLEGAYRPIWVVAPDLSLVAVITDATAADSGSGRQIKITFFNLEYRLQKLLALK